MVRSIEATIKPTDLCVQSLSSLTVHNNLRETTTKQAEIWSSESVSFSSYLYFILFCVCVEGENPSWIPGAFLP